MTFVPGKDSDTYSMGNGLFTKGSTSNYGGENKPVTVTFKLKDFSNAVKTQSAVGFKSLSGALVDFWKDKGGVNKITGNAQGMEVSDAFTKNQYSEYTDAQLNVMKHVDEGAQRAFDIRYTNYQNSKKQ